MQAKRAGDASSSASVQTPETSLSQSLVKLNQSQTFPVAGAECLTFIPSDNSALD